MNSADYTNQYRINHPKCSYCQFSWKPESRIVNYERRCELKDKVIDGEICLIPETLRAMFCRHFQPIFIKVGDKD